MLIEFWRGDYEKAEASSGLAIAMKPAEDMPSIYKIYHSFFRGLVLFHLYRTSGIEQRLNDGKAMLDRFEEWTFLAGKVFKNKWLLLKAEYCASMNDVDNAVENYEASINFARDHGHIHELALAYELLGNYHLERGFGARSREFFHLAYTHYNQWGAVGIAQKLLHRHELDADTVDRGGPSSKRREIE